ncbi:uncharacterized protein LOC129778360 [Toxorhynchites rutilus septentrionalis]|uniref:uncharacterized protein LOC129778360 n=1 Tax=Toxorhynchites rutilus septentrionalis TaxID=329112 RepID=UPI00247AA70D|nr:uncharacterized protein LOC129778360 [Toxorhynchites rutilus septentrionalis]
MARKGFPVTKYRVMNRVISYVEQNPEKGSFKTGTPSDAWFRSFMKRHKDLAIRKPEGVTNASANIVEQNLRNWFREVYGIAQEEDFVAILRKAKCVLNGDESSFYLDPATDKVCAMRGEKNMYRVEQGPAKKSITVMFTSSAAGKMYPPMVVLPYKKIPMEVIRSIPAEWGIGKTDSGWMNTTCFLEYVKNILHPQLVEDDALPAVYFVDGHSSHTTWETADECRKLQIHLVCLYANSTHILRLTRLVESCLSQQVFKNGKRCSASSAGDEEHQ